MKITISVFVQKHESLESNSKATQKSCFLFLNGSQNLFRDPILFERVSFTISCKITDFYSNRCCRSKKFWFSTDAKFLGCKTTWRVNRTVIPVGQNMTINDFWYSCDATQLRLKYEQGLGTCSFWSFNCFTLLFPSSWQYRILNLERVLTGWGTARRFLYQRYPDFSAEYPGPGPWNYDNAFDGSVQRWRRKDCRVPIPKKTTFEFWRDIYLLLWIWITERGRTWGVNM